MNSRFPKPYADFVQRLRVPAGFVLLGGFVCFARPSWKSIAYSLPVILAGMSLRAWAAGHLEKNENLTTSGPYAYTRNPLYLGSLVVAAGFVLAARSWWLGLLFVAAFAAIYLPVMEQEAAHLSKLFPHYAAYAAKVPLLLPLGGSRGVQGAKAFSWKLFWWNKEQKAWYGAGLGMAALLVRALLAP